jgi:hypothetical protein
MAPRKRAKAAARTVKKWRKQLEDALKAVRAAETQLRKLKKSAAIIITRSK